MTDFDKKLRIDAITNIGERALRRARERIAFGITSSVPEHQRSAERALLETIAEMILAAEPSKQIR